jgi:diadenylate cyclase
MEAKAAKLDLAACDTTGDDTASLMLSKCGFLLAKSLEVSKVMVQASEVRRPDRFEIVRDSQSVIWLTRSPRKCNVNLRRGDHLLELPQATITRENQLKVGMLLAVLNGVVEIDENVVCLSGLANSGTMDTLFLANPRRDFPWFQNRTIADIRRLIATREFVSILGVALRLANEGREGKPIGTCFVLGDRRELLPHVKQLVLNPCAGHPDYVRDIHNPDFFETIREFAGLDGAFVVGPRGIVDSAGTYLNALSSKSSLTPGFGARHAAARSITEVTSAMAIVVSSSSGTVSVFHEGQLVLQLDPSDVKRPSGVTGQINVA